jgi:hypothetical protein
VSETAVRASQTGNRVVERHLECFAAANLRQNLESGLSRTQA